MNVEINTNNNVKLSEEENKIFYNSREKHVFLPASGFEYVIKQKENLRDEAYGFIIMCLYKLNTRDVDRNLLIDVFKKVDKKYYMNKDDYEKYNKFNDKIVIFRGTNKIEKPPRISWTLDPQIAFEQYVESYRNGFFYTAIVDKESEVFAYYDDNEQEIVADVSIYSCINYME